MLEPEQEELLASMIEAERDVPRADRTWHLSLNDGADILQGPGGPRHVLARDILAFDDVGLARITGGPYEYGGRDFILTPAAHE